MESLEIGKECRESSSRTAILSRRIRLRPGLVGKNKNTDSRKNECGDEDVVRQESEWMECWESRTARRDEQKTVD
jgi:hypothetical protein